jgi:hypothetical protein
MARGGVSTCFVFDARTARAESDTRAGTALVFQ